MRRAAFLTMAFAFAAVAAGPSSPRVMRETISAVEKNIDRRFTEVMPENPYVVLGLTRGLYLDGVGAVFSLEMNLVPSISITPFYPKVSPERVVSTHKAKLARLVLLRQTMRDVLMDSAASLDVVPANERIVLGITIFNHNWEDTSGIPAQIVMQARRQVLLDLKAGRGDKTRLQSEIQVREF